MIFKPATEEFEVVPVNEGGLPDKEDDFVFKPATEELEVVPVNEEGGLPGEEDDLVKEVHPVLPQGVSGHMRGKIYMTP